RISMGIDSHHLDYMVWNRNVGLEQNHRVGLGHHQLCVVDWYWSRGNFDLCNSSFIPSKVASWYQSLRRSNDHFRSHLRRDVPSFSYGTYLVSVLQFSLPEQPRTGL